MALRYTSDLLSPVSSFSLNKPYRSDQSRDCFQDCVQRNVWGNRRIKLLDTTFWEQLAKDPDRYRDGFRKKNNLLECDFAVMPMFGQ
jgi:hypothetical protein